MSLRVCVPSLLNPCALSLGLCVSQSFFNFSLLQYVIFSLTLCRSHIALSWCLASHPLLACRVAPIPRLPSPQEQSSISLRIPLVPHSFLIFITAPCSYFLFLPPHAVFCSVSSVLALCPLSLLVTLLVFDPLLLLFYPYWAGNRHWEKRNDHLSCTYRITQLDFHSESDGYSPRYIILNGTPPALNSSSVTIEQD